MTQFSPKIPLKSIVDATLFVYNELGLKVIREEFTYTRSIILDAKSKIRVSGCSLVLNTLDGITVSSNIPQYIIYSPTVQFIVDTVIDEFTSTYTPETNNITVTFNPKVSSDKFWSTLPKLLNREFINYKKISNCINLNIVKRELIILRSRINSRIEEYPNSSRMLRDTFIELFKPTLEKAGISGQIVFECISTQILDYDVYDHIPELIIPQLCHYYLGMGKQSMSNYVCSSDSWRVYTYNISGDYTESLLEFLRYAIVDEITELLVTLRGKLYE